MRNIKTFNKKKVILVTMAIILVCLVLCGRVIYITVFRSDYYKKKTEDLQQRERSIKASRGNIYDRNGVAIATNKPVCTISVIHNQITDKEKVIAVLTKELEMDETKVRKIVEKVSSREKVKSNVDKDIATRIREYNLDGVMVDEDYKRYYPFGNLASKVIGFTGSDNQGIIGLEVEYEDTLGGQSGRILTYTNARGIELQNIPESRIEPIAGNDLYLSLDVNIQKYIQQELESVYIAKEAKNVSMIVMNPQNGEIYACVNVPEFDLNEPFTLNTETVTNGSISAEEKQNLLNEMWRNFCINDTYEPGSVFKIITATGALEEGVVSVNDTFNCPGYKIVGDRRIKCHKVAGHGAETFKEGIMNSCNPVFMEVGARLGAENMYKYFGKLGLFDRTGIDLPGEANSIMHKLENVEEVELATMSFGQSFQITPMQLITAVSTVINGGNKITPHFAVKSINSDGDIVEKYEYNVTQNVISKKTSETMKELLKAVVEEGGGSKAYIKGFSIGGKTATSEKLPRGSGKYISAFLGFSSAENPSVIALLLIDEPQGTYYGGTIAAPVVKKIFENILPYLGIECSYVEEETTTEIE